MPDEAKAAWAIPMNSDAEAPFERMSKARAMAASMETAPSMRAREAATAAKRLSAKSGAGLPTKNSSACSRPAKAATAAWELASLCARIRRSCPPMPAAPATSDLAATASDSHELARIAWIPE